MVTELYMINVNRGFLNRIYQYIAESQVLRHDPIGRIVLIELMGASLLARWLAEIMLPVIIEALFVLYGIDFMVAGEFQRLRHTACENADHLILDLIFPKLNHWPISAVMRLDQRSDLHVLNFLKTWIRYDLGFRRHATVKFHPSMISKKPYGNIFA